MQIFRIESFIDQRPIMTERVQASNIVAAVGAGARLTKNHAKKGKRIHQLVVRATKI